jgi:hypothetical protein
MTNGNEFRSQQRNVNVNTATLSLILGEGILRNNRRCQEGQEQANEIYSSGLQEHETRTRGHQEQTITEQQDSSASKKKKTQSGQNRQERLQLLIDTLDEVERIMFEE